MYIMCGILCLFLLLQLLFLNYTSKKSAENRKLLCMIQYFMKSVFISILTLQIECHVNAMSQQKQQQRNKHLNRAPTSVISSALVFLEATHQPWGWTWKNMPFLKPHNTTRNRHSSGAGLESRWPSWAVHPNKPYGFHGRKTILNHAHDLVSACP